MLSIKRQTLRRYQTVAALMIISSGIALYLYDLRKNPPGFFIDESSVAYNAHTISQTGRDEHGVAWPLFFRAFGEYKNPVYIYLVAAWFRLTGPGIFAARFLSAVLGLATAFVLAYLGTHMTGSRIVGLLVGLTTLLTPWLFELSRLVVEVALYPLVVATFLFFVWRASTKLIWGWRTVVTLAATLALLTYTYSIGRLLAPLLALGLWFFFSRARVRGLLLTFAAYALSLIPMLSVRRAHPEALTGRFNFVTYIVPESTTSESIHEFVRHYFANLNPWRLFAIEGSKTNELIHIPGAPAMLTITALLLVAGIVLIFRRKLFNAWWAFVIYGAIVSVVPASLTKDTFHMLRLAALPAFLITFTIPAFLWLVETKTNARKSALAFVMLVMFAQAAPFQWHYHASAQSPQRLHTFDADYPAKILPTALANSGSAPVYLADNPARPGYIQAYWYAVLQRIPLSKFVSLGFEKPAPEGAVVITTESNCPRCRVLAESEPYTTYIAQGAPRELAPLPDDGFKAEIAVDSPPAVLQTGQEVTIPVHVKNVSSAVWPARERSGAPFQLQAANHWLDENGNMLIHDNGRGPLPKDLKPSESVIIPLVINAPHRGGLYILEIDMLQEGVTWFASKGSQTVRLFVNIK